MSKAGIPVSDDDIHAVLELVAEGEYLKKACEMIGVHYSTVWRRCANDPEWGRRYEMAKEMFGEARASLISDYVRENPDPKKADVVAKHERWVVESLAKRQFGQNRRVEVSGPGGGPIEFANKSESELAALLARNMQRLGAKDVPALLAMAQRLAPKRLPQTIDAEVSSPATPEG